MLSDLVIELPPLADRREDIPLLAQQLLEECNAAGDRQISGFTPQVLDKLGALPWDGNVTELREIVEAAFAATDGPMIDEADLPARVGLIESAALYPPPEEEAIDLDGFLEEVERELIERAMGRAGGNKSQAARLLGIQRARLLRRLAYLGIG